MNSVLRATAVLLAATSSSVWAQCDYSLVVVERPTDWTGLDLFDMNEAGLVVGAYGTPASGPYTLPFQWSLQGGFESLPKPPGTYDVRPTAISDSGFIVGRGLHVDVEGYMIPQPIQWSGSGVVMPVPSVPPNSTLVQDVNSNGIAAGYYSTGPLEGKSFLWDGTVFSDVASELTRGYCYTRTVNDSGFYAGLYKLRPADPGQAFIASLRGDVEKLISPTGVVNLEFKDLNESLRGPLVGTTFNKSGFPTQVVFFWTGSELEPIPLPEGWKSISASRCNDFDQVLGRCSPLSGFGIMPFLWQDGLLTDLRTRVVLPPGIKIVQLIAIKNSGAILARGENGGQVYLLLLTPQTIDEDVNHDCRIDMRDLVAMIEAWSNPSSPIFDHADVNHDGVVDGQDLGAILGAWTP